MTESVVVTVVVAAAALFLARRWYRAATGNAGACDCCDTGSCPQAKANGQGPGAPATCAMSPGLAASAPLATMSQVSERRSPDDVWYFAYGSNLDPQQMKEREVPVIETQRACLADYRLAFNKRSQEHGVAANIVPRHGAQVWGVLYRCSTEGVRKLDGYEGVSGGHYEHKQVRVGTEEGPVLEAMTYVAHPAHVISEGRPSDTYLSKILVGAEVHGLPATYVLHIKKLAEAGE